MKTEKVKIDEIYSICGALYQVTKITTSEARGIRINSIGKTEVGLFNLYSYDSYIKNGIIKLIITTHELWI